MKKNFTNSLVLLLLIIILLSGCLNQNIQEETPSVLKILNESETSDLSADAFELNNSNEIQIKDNLLTTIDTDELETSDSSTDAIELDSSDEIQVTDNSLAKIDTNELEPNVLSTDDFKLENLNETQTTDICIATIITNENNTTNEATQFCAFRVNDNMPLYECTATVFKSVEYSSYNRIKQVVITDAESGSIIQTIKFPDGWLHYNENALKSAAYFIDISFDGNLDLLVPRESSAYYVYFDAFLWDNEIKQFVKNPSFEYVGNPSIDYDEKKIYSKISGDRRASYRMYTFKNNEFICTNKFWFTTRTNNQGYKNYITFYEYSFISGVETVVNKFYADENNFGIDPTYKSYTEPNSFWDLPGSKWFDWFYTYTTQSDIFLTGGIEFESSDETQTKDNYISTFTINEFNSANDIIQLCTFRVNENMPLYKCTVTIPESDNNYFKIKQVVISDAESGLIIQTIKFPDGLLHYNENVLKSAAYFIDISFDGNLDLLVPRKSGASYVSFDAFLWDNEIKQFIKNPSFENIGNFVIDYDEKKIYSKVFYDDGRRSYSMYTFKNNEFICTNNFLRIINKNTNHPCNKNLISFYEYRLISGNETIINEFNADENDFISDPNYKPYIEPNSFWDLNSSKWFSVFDNYERRVHG